MSGERDGEQLRLDWLIRPSHGVGGVALTALPGKHGRSTRYPGRIYAHDLETDLGVLAAADVRLLELLVDDAELARWGDPHIVVRAAAAGIRVVRRPMRDGSPPGSTGEMDDIAAEIDAACREGNVAIACMGGVGRTGTVAACLLVRRGKSAADAIAEVRRVRHPTAVETDGQVQLRGGLRSASLIGAGSREASGLDGVGGVVLEHRRDLERVRRPVVRVAVVHQDVNIARLRARLLDARHPL